MGAAARRDPVAHACQQQAPAHIWECKEQQASPTEGIDSPDRGPGKDEVDQTEAEGGQKSGDIVCSSIDEDCG